MPDIKREKMIDRLRLILAAMNLNLIKQTSDDTYVICSFEHPLSPENLDQLKRELFYTDKIEIEGIDSLIFVTGNDLHIQHKHYYIYSGIYEALVSMKAKVFKGRIDKSAVVFHYDRNARAHINYVELDELQQIVDPTIPMHDSIRVMGDYEEYTMTIRI